VAIAGVTATARPALDVGGTVYTGWEQVDTPFPVILVAPLFPLLAVAQPRLHRGLVLVEVLGVALAAFVTVVFLDFVLFLDHRRLVGFWLVVASQIAGLAAGGALAWRR
jgi:hypothetical protein